MTQQWTQELVADRFEEAVRTLKKLPPVKVQGYFNAMPAIIHTPNELMMQEPDPIRLRPTPDAISRLEETFEWIIWLEELERKIVWKRARLISCKSIGRQFGCCDLTIKRKWNLALQKISDRLNKLGVKIRKQYLGG